jgi:hypothetical protein
MAVEIKYKTQMREFKSRYERSTWFIERIPSHEFMIQTPSTSDDDGWEVDDHIITTVTIWDTDAEKIATEFWFKFP